MGSDTSDHEISQPAGIISANPNDPGRLAAICKETARIGAPRYYPRYLIQHGMNVSTEGNSDDELLDHFDADTARKKAMRNYLHCSNSRVITRRGKPRPDTCSPSSLLAGLRSRSAA